MVENSQSCRVWIQAGGVDRKTAWLEFDGLQAVLVARAPSEVSAVLDNVQAAVRGGRWAAGFLSYEAASGLDPALATHAAGFLPLVWFGIFTRQRLRDRFPEAHEPVARALDWTPDLRADGYEQHVARIRSYIAAGDTYQVNYTFRLRAPIPEPPRALAARVLARQAAGYAAYLETAEFALCSASPELFFAIDGSRVTCRPMKGTAARGMTWSDDRAAAEALRISEKDRAENIMIVDMVRNDLGRIARPGSIRVPTRFDVERYDTLWQMTSTVEALTSASPADVLRALFPSASVTGAPKIRTMQIIRELESSPRGAYCGCIGYFAPSGQASFNVAIRTVCVNRRNQEAEFGTGSGVVWDSGSESEFRECLTKTLVLDADPAPFDLIETIGWRPADGYVLLDRHLSRLRASADYFGFEFDELAIREHLARASISFEAAQRVRLQIDAAGSIRLDAQPLRPLPPVLRVALDTQPVRSNDRFLYHKTSRRNMYDQARARCADADDVILSNERGEITESTMANVAVHLDGTWYTPPITCGLLPGVQRAALLESGRLFERVLTRADWIRADEVALFNSVRGWMAAIRMNA